MSREGLYERIDLIGLSQDDIAEMIRSIFKRSAFSADFRVILHRDTGGNPFFALEVIKLLRDQGLISERNGVWREKGELTRFDIPERVHDVIIRRLQRLDEEQRDLLHAAAVQGERFTSVRLSELLGVDRLRVIKTLGRLGRAYQIVRSEGEGYAFSHPKIREVLYEEMPVELRRAYHVTLAGSMEREASDDPYRVSGELGFHFWNGGAIDRAIPYLIHSADRALRLFAYKEACGYYEQVLAGLEQVEGFPNGEEVRGEILQKAASSYQSLGQLDMALEQFLRLERCADETGSPLLKAKALQGIGAVHTMMRNDTEALDALHKSLQGFVEAGDLHGQCEVLNRIGNIYHERGEWETTVDYRRRALEIARQAGHKRIIAHVSTNLGVLFGIRGSFEQAMVQYRQAMKVYREIEDWTRVANVFNNMGKLCADSRMWERAKEYNDRALGILRRTKDIPTMALVYLNAAEIDLELSDTVGAKEACVRAIEMFGKLHDELGIADGLKALGMIGMQEGDWEGARSCFEKSLALNRDHQNTLGLAETLREYGVMLEMKGEKEHAVAKWREAQGFFEKLGAQESLKEVQGMITRLENRR
jgi:tetratricopeptide (TPR) repeat protein